MKHWLNEPFEPETVERAPLAGRAEAEAEAEAAPLAEACDTTEERCQGLIKVRPAVLWWRRTAAEVVPAAEPAAPVPAAAAVDDMVAEIEASRTAFMPMQDESLVGLAPTT